MYGLFEANEKHYVKILNIEDNTSWSTPCLTLRCRGYIYNRSRQAEKGIALDNYTITTQACQHFFQKTRSADDPAILYMVY